jgi:predicted amidohydrolase
MMICFDWFFPESARTLALRGAQVIAHPANLVLPYCQTAMVTRSLENAVFSVTTNRYGAETLGAESLTFTGASQVMDTRGRRLAQAPVAGDDMQVVEINPAEADDKQVNLRNHRFNDRRPELYG